MANMALNPQDKNFLKDAVYILRALQTVKTQVVFNAGELAAEEGVKVNSITKRFGEIRKRYRLNTATTAVGYTGDKTPVQRRKKVKPEAGDVVAAISPVMKRKAGTMEDLSDGTESHTYTKMSANLKKTSCDSKVVKREYRSDTDGDDDEDMKPSPAKKRSFLSDTSSEEDRDGYATAANE